MKVSVKGLPRAGEQTSCREHRARAFCGYLQRLVEDDFGPSFLTGLLLLKAIVVYLRSTLEAVEQQLDGMLCTLRSRG